MQSVLLRIKQNLNKLSDAEKRIGEYVLENPQLVPNMTTKDLSRNSGVSESTVVRFCKSIGIGSFKLFKLELVKELASNMIITDFSVLEHKDEPYELFQKVTHVNKAAIESMPATLERKELEEAIKVLAHAKKLLFFGVGGSATAAYDGYYKFARLGYDCQFNNDFHFLLSILPFYGEGDVFIAISMSGKTKDVIELAKLAKQRGVTVIAITNLDKSPLYRLADIHLCTPPVEHDFRIGSIPSRITQLTIIDALYLSVFLLKGEGLLESYYEARDSVVKLRR